MFERHSTSGVPRRVRLPVKGQRSVRWVLLLVIFGSPACAVDSNALPRLPLDSGSPPDMRMVPDLPVDQPAIPDAGRDLGEDTSVDTCPADCVLGCSSAEPNACATPLPSNIDPDLLDGEALPHLEIVRESFYDTTTCLSTAVVNAVLVDSGDPHRENGKYCVVNSGPITIEPTGHWRISGKWPLVLLAHGPVIIEGTLDIAAHAQLSGVSAVRSVAGAGGFAAAERGIPCAPCGPSAGAAGAASATAASGGAGGGGCSAGGAGGNTSSIEGAVAGPTSDGYIGVPLRGGSAGGMGGGDSSEAGPGGSGGGALQIFSTESISVPGEILAGGGGAVQPKTTSASVIAGGSGGGGGGTVLLEAVEISVSGNIDASGGGGSSGANSSSSRGLDAYEAFVAEPPSPPEGGGADIGAGGRGGYRAMASGAPGQSGGDQDGGGGGGGAGCIIIRDASGDPPGEGAFSPTIGMGTVSFPLDRT